MWPVSVPKVMVLWYPYFDSITTPATPTYSILLALLGPAGKYGYGKRKKTKYHLCVKFRSNGIRLDL